MEPRHPPRFRRSVGNTEKSGARPSNGRLRKDSSFSQKSGANSEIKSQTERENVGVEFVVAREDRFEFRIVLIAVNGIGTGPLGIGRRNVAVGQIDRNILAGTETQTRRIGDLRHRRSLGIEVVAAHGAFVDIHTHTGRQPVAGAVLGAETERERIGVVLDRIDRIDAQLLFIELHVERLVSRPADPLQIDGELLGAARPTAVNLRWAVGEMLDAAKAHLKDDRAELLEALYRKAVDIHEDDIAKCTAISEYGLSLLKDGDGVLTHCNAGPLATSRYGTGQGPFLLAAERGIHIRVFADETRPLLQGARLTSYELQRAGVDVTLICDNMASMVMKNGWVQACFVGCDRIAANGDFANKIGTSGVAILAKHYGIPVYTLGPTSTIDMSCPDGAHIPIELRDGDEIKSLWYEKPMALPEVKCFNPSFDVTDHSLLTGIVTEKGICYPPFTESLAALFKNEAIQ